MRIGNVFSTLDAAMDYYRGYRPEELMKINPIWLKYLITNMSVGIVAGWLFGLNILNLHFLVMIFGAAILGATCFNYPVIEG